MLYEYGRLGHGDRFRSVKKYWDLITEEKPELVLIAGDVTGDGSCGHGFHTAFFYLLSLLELSQIATCFIQGDNDLVTYYSAVMDNIGQFNYVKEISDQKTTHKGLRILGLPYETTAQKSLLNDSLSKYSEESFDIILSHSPLKRRTFLMGMDYKYLVTGHFDNKVFPLENKVFISLSNDSSVINYSTITKGKETDTIHYKFSKQPQRLSIDYKLECITTKKGFLYEDGLEVNGIPVPIMEYENMSLPRSSYEKDKNALALSIKFLRGQAYKNSLMMMHRIKSGEINSSKKLLKDKMSKNITANHKLSKTMLLDFLGSQVRSHLFS